MITELELDFYRAFKIPPINRGFIPYSYTFDPRDEYPEIDDTMLLNLIVVKSIRGFATRGSSVQDIKDKTLTTLIKQSVDYKVYSRVRILFGLPVVGYERSVR